MNGRRTAAESWNHVQVALGQFPADLLFRNCWVVNVYSREVHRADIAVREGLIVAVRENYGGEALETIEATGYYAAPEPVAMLPHGTCCSNMQEVRRTLRRAETVILKDDGHHAFPELLRVLHQQQVDTSHICLYATNPALALQAGFDLPQIFEMTSLNPAISLRIDHLAGSIAPGREANIQLFEEALVGQGKLEVVRTTLQS
jgi:adenine deaminase